MTQKHPITPPPELVQQWRDEWAQQPEPSGWVQQHIATQAARWGADCELEACEKWLSARTGFMDSHDLHIARRPQPPSLKQQALEELNNLLKIARSQGVFNPPDTIRRALEQLND